MLNLTVHIIYIYHLSDGEQIKKKKGLFDKENLYEKLQSECSYKKKKGLLKLH